MSAMIAAAYVRTMAAYNAEMNRRLYAASARISEVQRRKHCGVFWGSLHGTLCHLLWGDRMWMSRFDGWPKPDVKLRDSATLVENFDDLRTLRFAADAKISDWAARVTDEWLAGDLTWFSPSANAQLSRPIAFCVMHFFNHQTHHRGHAHGLITACGEETGDTDLFLVVPGVA